MNHKKKSKKTFPVLIGVGGSGVAVIMRLKRRVLELQKNLNGAKVRLLLIDTDEIKDEAPKKRR